MRRTALALLSSVLILGTCESLAKDADTQPAANPALVAIDSGHASAAFDAAVDQSTRTYYQQVPEAATYNGAPVGLTSSAEAHLNDRSIAGEAVRVAEIGNARLDKDDRREAKSKTLIVDAFVNLVSDSVAAVVNPRSNGPQLIQPIA